jgi:hypothetical protein
MEEKGDLFADSERILNSWKSHTYQLLNMLQ